MCAECCPAEASHSLPQGEWGDEAAATDQSLAEGVEKAVRIQRRLVQTALLLLLADIGAFVLPFPWPAAILIAAELALSLYAITLIARAGRLLNVNIMLTAIAVILLLVPVLNILTLVFVSRQIGKLLYLDGL